MKKNSANEHFLNRSAIKNLIKIMKISLLLLFAIIFHATAADSNVKDAVIEPNRNVNDERQFIHEIETQSNYMPETDVRDENVREIFETGKALQQGKTVRGKVVDEQGTAVIGATVVVKDNPTHGTVTDVDGMFTIANLPENAVLVFTYVGMKPQGGKRGRNYIAERGSPLRRGGAGRGCGSWLWYPTEGQPDRCGRSGIQRCV